MSDIDSLKLRFTDENPDRSSDDIETASFHSTPHAPEPPVPPKRIASRRAPSPEPPAMTRLTMGLSRSTVTPHGAVALAATGMVAALLAASAWPVAPLFVLSVVLLPLTAALGIEGSTGPVLADMERPLRHRRPRAEWRGGAFLGRRTGIRGTPRRLRTPRLVARRGRKRAGIAGPGRMTLIGAARQRGHALGFFSSPGGAGDAKDG